MHARELTAGAVRLGLLDAGPADATPLVLLHGWSQAAEAWTAQLTGPLAQRYRLVAPDLRGHGRSSTPPDGYADAAAWAADLGAVLAWLGRPAVVVGWSYGGLVIFDYLRERGADGLAGIALVGAITEIGRGREGGRIGPLMRATIPDAYSPDPAVALPALWSFVRDMAHRPLDGALTQQFLGNALRVRPWVRAALFDRAEGSTELLRGCQLPSLVVHGRQDPVVDVSAGEYAASLLRQARTHLMDGVGHAPFAEASGEFDGILDEFAADCTARVVPGAGR